MYVPVSCVALQFSDVMAIGRDMLRLLQGVARYVLCICTFSACTCVYSYTVMLQLYVRMSEVFYVNYARKYVTGSINLYCKYFLFCIIN